MKLITDVIRLFIWGITWAVLQIADWIYGISMNVASLDVGNFDVLWQWWGALSMVIGTFATFRMLILVFKYFFDSEYQDKIDVFKIFTRVLMVSAAIAFMPLCVKTATAAGSAAVTEMGTVFGLKSDYVPSTIIISSLLDEKAVTVIEGQPIEIMKEYKLSDIDINTGGEGDKDYKFFNTMGDLFIAMIMGAVAAVFILLIGIDVGKRTFSTAMLVLVSPLPISALINPDDTSFSRWQKLIMSNVLSNFFQVLALNFVLIASSSPWIRSQGAFAAIIAFIGGLFAILGGISELSSIIGGETGTQGTLQQLATIRQATRGIGGRGGGKGSAFSRGLSNAASLVGATAGYAVGRSLGGEPLGSNSTKKSRSTQPKGNGFKGSDARKNTNNARPNTSSFTTDSNGRITPNMEDETGNMYGQQNIQPFSNSSSKGEFSGGKDSRPVENVQNSFSDASSSNMNSKFSGNANNTTSSTNQFSQSEARPQGESANRENQSQQTQSQNQTQTSRQRYAKEGSFADRYANKAYSAKGNKFARVTANTGRHVYQSSVNRLQRTMPARTARALKNLASVPEDYRQERGDS